MRLLILTQVIDPYDPVLGFFVSWVRGLSVYFDRVDAIALRFVPTSIADNVFVDGADRPGSAKNRLRRRARFIVMAVRQVAGADVLFVHMIPEYVIAVGWLYRLLGKKVYFWYAHGTVTWKLRLAAVIANKVITSSEAGLRISTPKRIVIGQGIDTEKFSLTPAPSAAPFYTILSVGRISASKHYEEMAEAVKLLSQRGHKVELRIIGKPSNDVENAYADNLNAMFRPADFKSLVVMLGAKTQQEVPVHLAGSHVFVNLSDTGSLDKAVLEAMSSGVPVLTSNPAYFLLLPEKYLVRSNNPAEIANKLECLLSVGRDPSLRDIVIRNHSLAQFSKRLGTVLTS